MATSHALSPPARPFPLKGEGEDDITFPPPLRGRDRVGGKFQTRCITSRSRRAPYTARAAPYAAACRCGASRSPSRRRGRSRRGRRDAARDARYIGLRMVSTRLISSGSSRSKPSKRTRPSKGRVSSAGSRTCSRKPLIAHRRIKTRPAARSLRAGLQEDRRSARSGYVRAAAARCRAIRRQGSRSNCCAMRINTARPWLQSARDAGAKQGDALAAAQQQRRQGKASARSARSAFGRQVALEA